MIAVLPDDWHDQLATTINRAAGQGLVSDPTALVTSWLVTDPATAVERWWDPDGTPAQERRTLRELTLGELLECVALNSDMATHISGRLRDVPGPEGETEEEFEMREERERKRAYWHYDRRNAAMWELHRRYPADEVRPWMTPEGPTP